MNPYVILAALVLVGAMTSGAYWQGRKDGENAITAQEKREAELVAKAAEAAANTAAAAIRDIKVQHRTITQEVQREVIERPVYRDCRHDPVQLQRINAALTGEPVAPAGRGLVPPANAASR